MYSRAVRLVRKRGLCQRISRGLGEHFAEVLANAGCDLVVTSRDASSLELIQDPIEGVGRQRLALELDVLDYDSIQKAAERAVEHFGKIDILVCNAGCNRRKPAVDATWDDWNLLLDTNLRGSFFLAQAVVKRSMPPRGYRPGHHARLGYSRPWLRRTGAIRGPARGGIKQLTA